MASYLDGLAVMDKILSKRHQRDADEQEQPPTKKAKQEAKQEEPMDPESMGRRDASRMDNDLGPALPPGLKSLNQDVQEVASKYQQKFGSEPRAFELAWYLCHHQPVPDDDLVLNLQLVNLLHNLNYRKQGAFMKVMLPKLSLEEPLHPSGLPTIAAQLHMGWCVRLFQLFVCLPGDAPSISSEFNDDEAEGEHELYSAAALKVVKLVLTEVPEKHRNSMADLAYPGRSPVAMESPGLNPCFHTYAKVVRIAEKLQNRNHQKALYFLCNIVMM